MDCCTVIASCCLMAGGPGRLNLFMSKNIYIFACAYVVVIREAGVSLEKEG